MVINEYLYSLKRLCTVHALWFEPVTQTLPGELKAALSMSNVEQASLRREVNLKASKGSVTFKEESQIDRSSKGHAVMNDTDIRNWLKGIRDSGYNVLDN